MQELLERLQKVDPDTFDEYFRLVDQTAFNHWPICFAEPGMDEYTKESEIIYGAIVQNVIQRAIEAKGWTWHLAPYTAAVYRKSVINNETGDVGWICPGHAKEDSTAKSVLSAYLAALEDHVQH